jgi:hypothetical protein
MKYIVRTSDGRVAGEVRNDFAEGKRAGHWEARDYRDRLLGFAYGTPQEAESAVLIAYTFPPR